MNEPWKFQKELGDIKWSPEELASKLLSIEKDKQRLDMAFIFSLLYLAGARAEEILSYKKKDSTTPIPEELLSKEQIKSSLRFKDIWISKLKGDRLELVISVRVLKTRETKETRREVHIPIDKGYYAYPIVGIVERALEISGWSKPEWGYYEDNYIAKNNNEQPFFTLSSNWVEQYCNKELGINLHSLRHFKFHHLATIEKLSPFEIQQVGGWKDYQMPFLYSKGNSEDIRNKSWRVIE